MNAIITMTRFIKYIVVDIWFHCSQSFTLFGSQSFDFERTRWRLF